MYSGNDDLDKESSTISFVSPADFLEWGKWFPARLKTHMDLFAFLDATKHLWVVLSFHQSTCQSHLFDYITMIESWWYFKALFLIRKAFNV